RERPSRWRARRAARASRSSSPACPIASTARSARAGASTTGSRSRSSSRRDRKVKRERTSLKARPLSLSLCSRLLADTHAVLSVVLVLEPEVRRARGPGSDGVVLAIYGVVEGVVVLDRVGLSWPRWECVNARFGIVVRPVVSHVDRIRE